MNYNCIMLPGYDSEDGFSNLDMHAAKLESVPSPHHYPRGYNSIPRDDPVERAYIQNNTHTPSSHRVYGPAMFIKSGATNNAQSNANGDYRRPRPSTSRSDSNLNKHTLGRSDGSSGNKLVGNGTANSSHRPKYNNFTGTVPSSRYKSDEPPSAPTYPEKTSLSDRDRILQSYGYHSGTVTHSHNNHSSPSDDGPEGHVSHYHHPHELQHKEGDYSDTTEQHTCHHCAQKHLDYYHTGNQQQISHHDNSKPEGAVDSGAEYSQPHRHHHPRHSKSVPNISMSADAGTSAGSENADDDTTGYEQDEYYAGEPAVYVKTKNEGGKLALLPVH